MSLYHISGPNDVQIAADKSKAQDVTVVYERLTKQSTCQVSEIDPVQMSGIGNAEFAAYDATPMGKIPPGGNGFFPMGADRDNVSVKGDNGYTYSAYETLVPGVHYILDGKPYNMPAGYSQAPLPQGVFQVEYPAVYNGRSVPQSLPRPLIVGNKLVMLPKQVGDLNKIWVQFLARIIMPLAVSHGSQQWFKNISWHNLVEGDLDFNGWIDYVTGLPQYLPGVEFRPEGVKYWADKEKTEPLYIPNPRNTMSIADQNALPPLPIPPNLTVEYPFRWNGAVVPEWLPKPVVVNGQLQLLPKRSSGHYEAELQANFYFWLTFLTSVMMPLVSGFAKNPYNTGNERLSNYIFYDTDTKTVIDYLNPPDKPSGTFVGNLIRDIWGLVKDGAAVALKITAAGPRSAFLGLVRLNVKGFATNMKASLDNAEKREKMLADWRQLGGSAGDLTDAIEDGSKKDRILGPTCNCGTIGEPITVAAAITAAAPIIAALAAWLKGQVPEASAAVDLALNELNRALEDAGYDPLGFGNNWGKEVTVKDPNTGNDIDIPPPPTPGVGTGIWDLIRANPVPSALIAIAIVGVATDGFKFK